MSEKLPSQLTENPAAPDFGKENLSKAWESRRIAEFVNSKGIDKNNYQQIKFEVVLEFSNSSPTDEGKKLAASLSKLDTISAKYPQMYPDKEDFGLNKEKILQMTTNDQVLQYVLNKEKPPTSLDHSEAMEIYFAMKIFFSFKEKVGKYLLVVEGTSEDLKSAREGVNLQGKLDQGFGYLWKEGLHNWDKLPTAEKALFAMVTLFGGYMLWNESDENSIGGKIKGFLKTALTVGGLAFFANTLTKIFTGSSVLDWTSKGVDYATGTSTRKNMLEVAFEVDAATSESIQKTIVATGELPVLAAIASFEAGKNTKTFETDKMDKKEAYAALEKVFAKYPAEELKKRYANANPQPTLAQAITEEMVNDERLGIENGLLTQLQQGAESLGKTAESLYKKVTDAGKSIYENIEGFFPGVNATMTGVLLAETWKTANNKSEVDLVEIKKFSELFITEVKSKEDLDSAFRFAIAPNDSKSQSRYLELMKEGKKAKNVQYLQTDPDFLYVVVETNLNHKLDNTKNCSDTLKAGLDDGKNFIKQELKVDDKYLNENMGKNTVFVQDTTSGLIFLKVKKP